jgi:ubiquinone/menaquinone biosynthesis C-methylase UbiE
MSVASHLGINILEYDACIRTFIPDYEEMLDVAASALPARTRQIVDLGTGTGALASRCLEHAPKARVTGIDTDPEILKLASQRLSTLATFVCGTFLRTPFPPCDVVTASFALHHVRTRKAKLALYQRVKSALRSRGLVITVDCHPAAEPTVARQQHEAWLSHLCRAYKPPDAKALLASWAEEDVYVPLEAELAILSQAGFSTEVLWRKGAFAVLRGKRRD